MRFAGESGGRRSSIRQASFVCISNIAGPDFFVPSSVTSRRDNAFTTVGLLAPRSLVRSAADSRVLYRSATATDPRKRNSENNALRGRPDFFVRLTERFCAV